MKPCEIFRILKAVYGLLHAPRAWGDKLGKELRSQGWVQSRLEPCVWRLYEEGELCGLIAIHVDDVFCCGAGKHFNKKVSVLKESFPFGSWRSLSESTTFCGCELRGQLPCGTIELSQERYGEGLVEIPLSKERRPERDEEVTEAEWKLFGAALAGSQVLDVLLRAAKMKRQPLLRISSQPEPGLVRRRPMAMGPRMVKSPAGTVLLNNSGVCNINSIIHSMLWMDGADFKCHGRCQFWIPARSISKCWVHYGVAASQSSCNGKFSYPHGLRFTTLPSFCKLFCSTPRHSLTWGFGNHVFLMDMVVRDVVSWTKVTPSLHSPWRLCRGSGSIENRQSHLLIMCRQRYSF